MTRRVGAAVAVIVCATQGAALRGDEAQDARIRALADQVQQLVERVRQLEQRVLPRPASLRQRFEARVAQDLATYSQPERQEIESLYQDRKT